MNNIQIDLHLNVEEVNKILEVLGHTQTASGVYPLLIKVKGQADACYAAAMEAANRKD